MILVQVGVGGIKQLAPQAAPMSMSSILEVRGPPVLLTTPPGPTALQAAHIHPRATLFVQVHLRIPVPASHRQHSKA